ncbi:MAG: HEPN domain-containing protein, partial [Candidatus Diapherotrites archaeon]|nr:HEPN domain-containing protein [Candidatus Diapherotrites archaeon]
YLSEMDKCFEQGLLKKTEKSKTFALSDIKQAEFFLNESFDLLNLKKREMSAIALYNAVFHASRALLFLNGVKEKSHYCLQKYLEEIFVKSGVLSDEDLSLFDLLRGLRQEVQYNVVKVEFEEDLDSLYNKAEDFIGKIKKFVNAKSK